MYNGRDTGSLMFVNWWGNEFWCFVLMEQEVDNAQTFLDYPPMQKSASVRSLCRIATLAVA